LPTLAHGIAAILRPFSIVAALLAMWRIAADMQITQPFGIAEGPFSHWQPWFAVVLLLEGVALVVRQFFGAAPSKQIQPPALQRPAHPKGRTATASRAA
jgi:hypothetical protein